MGFWKPKKAIQSPIVLPPARLWRPGGLWGKALRPPERGQRTRLAVHGIAVGQRHLRDGFQGLGMLALAAAAEIVASALGIGADDAQIGRRPQALMAGAAR